MIEEAVDIRQGKCRLNFLDGKRQQLDQSGASRQGLIDGVADFKSTFDTRAFPRRSEAGNRYFLFDL